MSGRCRNVGVAKDEEKMVYFLEQAAIGIGGHPDARFHLGKFEGENGRYERAACHFIIAANQEYDQA